MFFNFNDMSNDIADFRQEVMDMLKAIDLRLAVLEDKVPSSNTDDTEEDFIFEVVRRYTVGPNDEVICIPKLFTDHPSAKAYAEECPVCATYNIEVGGVFIPDAHLINVETNF